VQKFRDGHYIRPPSIVFFPEIDRPQSPYCVGLSRTFEVHKARHVLCAALLAFSVAGPKTIVCLAVPGFMTHQMQSLLFAVSFMFEIVEVHVPQGVSTQSHANYLFVAGRRSSPLSHAIGCHYIRYVEDVLEKSTNTGIQAVWYYLGADQRWNESVTRMLDAMLLDRIFRTLAAFRRVPKSSKEALPSGILSRMNQTGDSVSRLVHSALCSMGAWTRNYARCDHTISPYAESGDETALADYFAHTVHWWHIMAGTCAGPPEVRCASTKLFYKYNDVLAKVRAEKLKTPEVGLCIKHQNYLHQVKKVSFGHGADQAPTPLALGFALATQITFLKSIQNSVDHVLD
jgi:hypothetical protein